MSAQYFTVGGLVKCSDTLLMQKNLLLLAVEQLKVILLQFCLHLQKSFYFLSAPHCGSAVYAVAQCL